MSSNLWTSSDCNTGFSWLLQLSSNQLQHDNGVHMCSMTYSSTALGDSKSCCRAPVCHLMSPADSPSCAPGTHGHRGQVHTPAHSCSAVGVTRPGCTGAVLTWPPKAIKNQLSHQTRLSKLFLCLEMMAQSGKTAAYKPLPFFLLLTFPGQAVYPWFLRWKRYIPEIRDRQKTQPLPSELNHTARAGLGILLALPKPSCSKGSSKEDLTLPSLTVRDALQRLHKTAQYSSKPRWWFPLSPTKVSRCQLFNFSWQTTQAGISTISWTI